MALLYGALVLLIGAGLLATSSSCWTGRSARSRRRPTRVTSPSSTTPPALKTTWNLSDARSVMRTDALHHLLNNGLLYFGVIVMIGSIGGYLPARQRLRPVARITATASSCPPRP